MGLNGGKRWGEGRGGLFVWFGLVWFGCGCRCCGGVMASSSSSFFVVDVLLFFFLIVVVGVNTTTNSIDIVQKTESNVINR